MQRLKVSEEDYVECPLRANAPDEEDRFVTVTYCEGCTLHRGVLRGGGGAQATAPIGNTPTAVDCDYQPK